ncbi:MAG: phospholipase D family protein [Steroidobacteraceae bacterium]
MPTRMTLRTCAVLLTLLIAGCSSLAPRPELPSQNAVALAQGTALDELIANAEVAHPGQSGFRLVREGPEAFAIRARTALVAGRSLDVQTYIWHDDATGAFLAFRALEAADRGVKVRLLVDDMDARGKNYKFAALDAHPNIEVRMFNPFGSRTGALRFAFEAMGSFSRINRRMHNKTWIADNRIAVVGGRNRGDEYFGASKEVNFVDLDFAMVGPVVRDASASFDRYWNSQASYPMALLAPGDVTAEALAALRKSAASRKVEAPNHPFAIELRNSDAIQRLVAGDWPMHWTSQYRFVSDDPAKAVGKRSGLGGSDVLAVLAPALQRATRLITVISPYFVPGKEGTRYFVDQVARGTGVRVLTNSLAANDVAMVYGGYSKARPDLLAGGVKLWELKPLPGTGTVTDSKQSMFGSSGASLHTKALAVDSTGVFVGSYNLDPRSTSLNCEQGVFVDEPVIAAQIETLFDEESAGERAWSVTLDHGKLRWTDGTNTYDSSPAASSGQRFQAWLAKVLPLDSQL